MEVLYFFWKGSALLTLMVRHLKLELVTHFHPLKCDHVDKKMDFEGVALGEECIITLHKYYFFVSVTLKLFVVVWFFFTVLKEVHMAFGKRSFRRYSYLFLVCCIQIKKYSVNMRIDFLLIIIISSFYS